MFLRLAVFAVLLATTSTAGAEPPISFDRDVRPILSDKCFFCHGPDAQKREADLRLDDHDAAVEAGAIVVGKPDESELIRRILSTDDDERMPPPSSKLERLTEQQAATLQRWIEQGANYEKHWSFVSLKPVPGASSDTTASIDHFVAEGLGKRGLKMQPEADRETLIRRLSFDITGLPPTVAEVEAFLADQSPDAYERLVDRLLASEHYGERMAVDWLDIARYADSYGFQVDEVRRTWPWRDWVIKAFNQNQPFDEFVTWQLAGDLLPNPTEEQLIATAFNRLHQQECEGGSIEEEYRVEYVCDRVQTFATAFLGLTFECTRCHDHKFDPITQREYYQFFSMFQNINESGLYSAFTPSTPTPSLLLEDSQTKQELSPYLTKVKALEKKAPKLRASRREAFEQWLAEIRSAGKTDPEQAETRLPRAGDVGRFRFDVLTNNSLANEADPDQPAKLKGDNKLVPGHAGQAIEFTGDDPVTLPVGHFSRHEPFSVALWMKTPDVKERAVVFCRSYAWTDAGSRGYELTLEKGRLKWSLIHFWPGNAISIATSEPFPVNEWVHVAVTSDGSSRAAGLKIFLNGRPATVDVLQDRLVKTIDGGGAKIAGEDGENIKIGQRFRDRGFTGGFVDDFRVFDRSLTSLEVAAFSRDLSLRAMVESKLAETETTDTAAQEQLFDLYLATVDEPWSQYLASLKTARAELNEHSEAVHELMVMQELPQPKKAYILFRGEYSQRRDEVHAGTPAVLSPFPEGAPENRLGLAQWLTDRQHPLMARVTVNRVWQSIFGRGLVKTAEDFGSQGARPSYPEVLDTLALGFIDSGWNTKQLVKTIVMTKTYRQRSMADAQTMEEDPENEWLARGPRFRLSAEMIRDNALVAAGLLNPKLGGPPVNPYEMAESFKPRNPKNDEDVYRRSLYTNWRRTGPPPAMIAFDASRRAVCTAKRERTDSPLQALILLNGVQYVEAARVLGETLYRDAEGDVPTMIEQGCLRCLSRRPDARETEIFTQLYHEQRDYFEQHPEEAEALLKIGRAPHQGDVPAAQAAAATALAQALLNHDACVVKR